MYMLLVFILSFLLVVIAILSIKIKLYIKVKNNIFEEYLKIFIINIPIWKIDLTKKRGNKRNKKILDNAKSNIRKTFSTSKAILKEGGLNLEKFNLKASISTTDAILTSTVVLIVSNFIAFALKFLHLKVDRKNFKYSIHPLYIDKKVLNVKLDCIISVNLAHITYVIFKNFRKWRCDIYGRGASNRKPYGNCNE